MVQETHSLISWTTLSYREAWLNDRDLPGHIGHWKSIEEGQQILQFTSVTQSCPTFCELMDCSTPGLPVHHEPLEFTQTHVHRVGDAIQPSHTLSSPALTW